jgi:phosphoribosylglycinamide formyltransferase-1
MSRPRVAVLISGRGSNLAALLAAERSGRLAANIVGAYSSHGAAPGLDIARRHGVAAHACDVRHYPNRDAFEAELFARIDEDHPDWLVLAGFMRVLSPATCARYAGRMVNLHPSLLPKYPGLDTHRRALEAKDREHGASVHFVVPALDQGPVLARVRIPIHPGDTPESLAARLLPREHALLVATVDRLASGSVQLRGERIWLDGRELTHPMELDDADRLLAVDLGEFDRGRG